MELIVETQLQLQCQHGLSDSHPDYTEDGRSAICFPPTLVDSQIIDYPLRTQTEVDIVTEAFNKLANGEADMIQVMSRRL